MPRARRSICAVLVMLLVAGTTNMAAPARACGCGAYIPDQAGASVVDERALISWDGSTENILMSFGVDGSSERAAWVMPVPSTAHVDLGEAAVFDELDRLTAPRIEYRDSWWPTFSWLSLGSDDTMDGTGARPGAVDVLSTQRIGPFEVTRIDSADSAALADWLGEHGFPQPDGLADNLDPYVEYGWEIVAIQLASDTPGADGGLSGTLQPLRLSFASDALIYPMRLSRAATVPQNVDLSVLAQHRMDPTSVPVAGSRPTLRFAGPLGGADVSAALAPYAGDGTYLTRWSDRIDEPGRIDGDYVFEQAAADTPHQQVTYRSRNRGDITGALLLAGVLVVALAVLVLRRRGAQAR